MSRPRIAVVTDAIYPWHKGGKEIRYRELLARLADDDFDVTVYTMRWWDKPPAPVITTRGSLRYRAICPTIDLYTSGGRRSIPQALIFALACFRLLFAHFDLIEADHMPYFQILPLRLVAWLHRVPLVTTWHEVWGTEYWKSYLGPPGILAAVLERLVARLSDSLITHTAATAAKLAALGIDPSSIHVIPLAVDSETMSAVEPDPSAPDLISVGRLLDHKRVDVVISALALLDLGACHLDHAPTLGIIGTGPELKALTDQAHELGVSNRVRFYGNLEDHAQVWGLLKGAKVVVQPSEREGFGMVVAEAAAANTPVVCSDTPANESRHLVINKLTGTTVPAGDAEAFAGAITHWLAHPSPDIASHFSAAHPRLSWERAAAIAGGVFHAATARKVLHSQDGTR